MVAVGGAGRVEGDVEPAVPAAERAGPAGVSAMTLLAWYGPWAWPAWPAFTAIDLAFGSNSAFAELPLATRAVAVTLLIALNVSFWGVMVWAALHLTLRAAGAGRRRSTC